MSIFKSFIIAFAMYSKIPMPKIEWKEQDMKFVLCFFPVIGAVIGCLFYGLWILCKQNYFTISHQVFAITGAVLPIMISGGIHLDGFMDTMDALHSYQDRERKLEILKDPHIGAFAAISLVCYMLLYVAGLHMIRNKNQVLLVCIGFFLSRTFSGLSLVTIKSAKKEGLLYTFASTAHKKIVCIILLLELLIGSWACYDIGGIRGICCIVCSLLVFVFYRHVSLKQFGGITGDLAGWFLMLYEIIFVWLVAISEVFLFIPY